MKGDQDDLDFRDFRKQLKARIEWFKQAGHDDEYIELLEPLYPCYRSKDQFLATYPNIVSRQELIEELRDTRRRYNKMGRHVKAALDAIVEKICNDEVIDSRESAGNHAKRIEQQKITDHSKHRPR